jgi:hypothetical protein
VKQTASVVAFFGTPFVLPDEPDEFDETSFSISEAFEKFCTTTKEGHAMLATVTCRAGMKMFGAYTAAMIHKVRFEPICRPSAASWVQSRANDFIEALININTVNIPLQQRPEINLAEWESSLVQYASEIIERDVASSTAEDHQGISIAHSWAPPSQFFNVHADFASFLNLEDAKHGKNYNNTSQVPIAESHFEVLWRHKLTKDGDDGSLSSAESLAAEAYFQDLQRVINEDLAISDQNVGMLQARIEEYQEKLDRLADLKAKAASSTAPESTLATNSVA